MSVGSVSFVRMDRTSCIARSRRTLGSLPRGRSSSTALQVGSIQRASRRVSKTKRRGLSCAVVVSSHSIRHHVRTEEARKLIPHFTSHGICRLQAKRRQTRSMDRASWGRRWVGSFRGPICKSDGHAGHCRRWRRREAGSVQEVGRRSVH